MIKLILLAILSTKGIEAQVAPYARSLGISDSDLLRYSPIVPGRKIRVRANGVVQDEVDDYNDFEVEALANGKGAKANHGLKQVTYKPIPQEYNIPSLDVEERSLSSSSSSSGSSASMSNQAAIPTLSPVPQKTAQQRVALQGVPQRQGYFFQHYPWDRLPHRYLVRPGFQYTYPTQYQNTQYYYPAGLPYKDPYNIYASANGCGGGCGQGCGNGCGQSSGGCGGSSGCGGDCVDCGGSYEDSAEYSDESTSSEEVSSGRSGEAHLINKKDPLDDLDLEDLERIDKAGSTEKGL